MLGLNVFQNALENYLNEFHASEVVRLWSTMCGFEAPTVLLISGIELSSYSKQGGMTKFVANPNVQKPNLLVGSEKFCLFGNVQINDFVLYDITPAQIMWYPIADAIACLPLAFNEWVKRMKTSFIDGYGLRGSIGIKFKKVFPDGKEKEFEWKKNFQALVTVFQNYAGNWSLEMADSFTLHKVVPKDTTKPTLFLRGPNGKFAIGGNFTLSLQHILSDPWTADRREPPEYLYIVDEKKRSEASLTIAIGAWLARLSQPLEWILLNKKY